jgi:hypothetical protein
VGDYSGIILIEKQEQCLSLFLRHLYQHKNWDFAYINDLKGTSAISNIVGQQQHGCFFLRKRARALKAATPHLYISLPNSISLLLKDSSGHFRHHLNWYRKKLEKDCQKIEFKSHNELGTVENAVKLVINLHLKRWHSIGIPSPFSDHKTRQFYFEVSRKFAENGWLNIFFLTANDEPIGAMYCVQYHRKTYYMFGGVDPEYSDYSIGTLILEKALENCIERKMMEFHLGNFGKFRYPVKENQTWNLRIINDTPNAYLVSAGAIIDQILYRHRLKRAALWI